VLDDGVYAAAAGAFAKLGAEIGEVVRVAGGYDFYLAGVGVADPAVQVELGGFAVDEPAEADALHASANKEVENHQKSVYLELSAKGTQEGVAVFRIFFVKPDIAMGNIGIDESFEIKRAFGLIVGMKYLDFASLCIDILRLPTQRDSRQIYRRWNVNVCDRFTSQLSVLANEIECWLSLRSDYDTVRGRCK